ncbi:MAG: hypothetical protein AAB738_01545, partial [Patescibacteria group bacterium]
MNYPTIVIKIGSNSLLTEDSKINTSFLSRLAQLLRDIKKRNINPLLVLSGAVCKGPHSLDTHCGDIFAV